MNKLTSLTGFGEGDPKPDKSDSKKKALSNKVSKVTRDQKHDSPNRLTGWEKDQLRKKHGTNRLTGSMMDEGRAAKSKALSKRSGDKTKDAFEGTHNAKCVHCQSGTKHWSHSSFKNPKGGQTIWKME